MDRAARVDLIRLWLDKAHDNLMTAADDLKLGYCFFVLTFFGGSERA